MKLFVDFVNNFMENQHFHNSPPLLFDKIPSKKWLNLILASNMTQEVQFS